MRIAIGSDHAGFEQKAQLVSYLVERLHHKSSFTVVQSSVFVQV